MGCGYSILETVEVCQCFRESLADATGFWGERFIGPDDPPQGCRLYGDRYLLRIAFSHVLENAVRYTPPDQPVTLRIAKNDYWLDVTVQNKSFSPLPDNTESFFQKFCHGSANVNTISPGLGLYLTRSIVKQHGGNLEMTTDENRNVIAKIRLPLKTCL